MVKGCDLSPHQNPADPAALAAAGVRFAFLKTVIIHADGTVTPDPVAGKMADDLRQAGILIGCYAWLEPTAPVLPQVQAFHVSALEIGGRQLPPGLDFEWTGNPDRWLTLGTMPARAKVEEMIGAVTAAFGLVPFAYTSDAWVQDALGGTFPTVNTRLWLAASRIPAPFSSVVIQQDGEDAERNDDYDHFNGTEDELNALAGPVA